MESKIEFVKSQLASITQANFLDNTVAGIRLVEKFTSLTGIQRKQLLTSSINGMISLVPGPEQILLQTLSASFLSPIIDSLVYMANLNFTAVTNCCFGSKPEPKV